MIIKKRYKFLLLIASLYISMPIHNSNESKSSNSDKLKERMFDIKDKVQDISREFNDCHIKNGKIISKNNKEITLHLASDSNRSNQLLALLFAGSLTSTTGLLILLRDPYTSIKTLLTSSILMIGGLTLICSNDELLEKCKKK